MSAPALLGWVVFPLAEQDKKEDEVVPGLQLLLALPAMVWEMPG